MSSLEWLLNDHLILKTLQFSFHITVNFSKKHIMIDIDVLKYTQIEDISPVRNKIY